jgi:hypothetical protein
VTDATPPPRPRGPSAALIECIIVAAIVFAAYAISRPPAVATLGRLYDDVVYLSVGKSIADGHGYRSAHLVGTPVHAKFPPLLPAIYAAAWATFGSLDAVARVALWLSILVTAASAGALWWLARHELGVGRAPAALFVAVPIVTDRTMFYFGGAASEPWMLLGWTMALLLVRRLTRLAEREASAAGTATALGLTLAATTLARTQGAAIAGAVLLALVVSRVGRRAAVIAAAATAAPLLAWRVWHGAMMARGPLSPLPDQGGYLAWIPTSSAGAFGRFAASMARESIPLYWSNTADVIVGWTSPKTLALSAAVIATGIVGVAMVARRFPALAASLIAMAGVLAIWPYVQDRFLTPVLPVLGIAGAFAVERMLDGAPRLVRRGGLVACVALACVLVAESARMRAESMHGASNSRYARAIDDIADWVSRRTEPDDHIMVSWGGAIYLRTGRRTAIANPEEPTLAKSVLDSPNRFYATRLIADSVDDVIIWDFAPGRAAPLLRALATRCPGSMTEVPPDSTGIASDERLHFYRVRNDLPCVAELARGTP